MLRSHRPSQLTQHVAEYQPSSSKEIADRRTRGRLCVHCGRDVDVEPGGAGGARTRDQRIMSPQSAPPRPGETVSWNGLNRL